MRPSLGWQLKYKGQADISCDLVVLDFGMKYVNGGNSFIDAIAS